MSLHHGFAAATAAAIAATCSLVSDSPPMPPLLRSMASWMRAASFALLLKIGAIAPWHPWQLAA